MASSKEITQLNQINKGLIATDKNINAVASSYLSLVKSIESGNQVINNNAISFDNLKRAQKETKQSAENLDKLDKQLQATKTRLIELDDKRQQQLLRNKAEIQKQTKSIKDLNRAKQAEKGSTEQLAAVNVILEKRLRSVNQTTDKGKRSADLLRSAIDKNNKKITEQSSAFVKQKRSIGGYSQGIQDAAAKTGFFSRELTIISRLQATLTLLTQKETKARNAATAATTLGSKALNIFKVALISTGVGAIVVALGSLVAFFKSSEEGAAALQRTLSPFKILFGNIKDLAIKLGEGLFNAFKNPKEAVADLWAAIKTNILNRITGIIDVFRFFGKTIKAAFDLDFDAVKENAAKAGESLIQSMTGVDDAVGKATKSINKFAEETKKENEQNKALVTARLALIKREREANVELAKLEIEIQNNRLKLKDEENLSNEERLVFAEKAQEQIRQQAAIEEELAAKRLKFRQLENSFSTSSQEDLDAEAQLRVELINVEAAGVKKLLRIESEKQTILKKLKTDELNNEKELRKEREQFIEADETAIELEIAAEENKQERLLEAEIKGREKRNAEAKKDAEAQLEFEKQKATEIVSIASAMGDALGALASGQIKTFKDFSKEILIIALNALEKQILITQTAILAKDISTKGFLGIATAAVKIGLIKAAFSGVKGAIAAFNMGTDNAPSEFIAGDKKGGGSARELMFLRDGTTMLVNEPTYFKGDKFKGATIKSNIETERILAQSNKGSAFIFDDSGLRSDMKSIVAAIKKKPTAITDKRGKVVGKQTGSSREYYIERLTNGR
jgi:hypothetical protein